MAVATAAALVGTGLSAYQAIKANKEKKNAQREMDNYQRQDLANPYKDVRLSTYGTDVMREESQRNTASLTEASRNAGIRGIMGAIPKIQANANKVNQNIGMDLERQDIRRQENIARGEERIMHMNERRDFQNLNAISSQYNAANEDFNKGLWGAASGLASAARQTDFGGFTPQVSGADAGLASSGASALSGGYKAPIVPKLNF